MLGLYSQAKEIRDSDISEGEPDEILGYCHSLAAFSDRAETSEDPDTSDRDFVELGEVSDQYSLDSDDEDDLFFVGHPILDVKGAPGYKAVPIVGQQQQKQQHHQHRRLPPANPTDDADDESNGNIAPPLHRWRPQAKRPLDDTSSDDEDGEMVCRPRKVPSTRPSKRAFLSSDED